MARFVSKTELVSTSIAGNLHVARNVITEWGLSDFVHTLSYGGDLTTAIFRVPKDMALDVTRFFGYVDPETGEPV